MSKYDKEREALGLNSSGASSKYATERDAIMNPNKNYALMPQNGFADFRKAEQQMEVDAKPDAGLLNSFTSGFGKGLGYIGRGLQIPSDIALNTSKNLLNLTKGKPLEWKNEYQAADYLRDIGSVDTNKISSPFLRNAANASLNLVTDPLTYVGGGIVDDMLKLKNVGKNINALGDFQKGALGKATTWAETPKPKTDFYTDPIGNTSAAEGAAKEADSINKINLQTFSGKTKDLGYSGTKESTADRIVFDGAKNKKSIKNMYDTAYTRLVDSFNPIKKVDDTTYTLATNSKNVGGTVDYILKDGLADLKGNTIGKSLKEVAKDIPAGKEKEFWDYMLHRHNVGRAPLEKNVFTDYDASMSRSVAKEYEQKYPQFKKAQKDIRNFVDRFMDEWGNKSGLVSDELLKDLRIKYPDYIPTQRAFEDIEKNVVNFGKRGFVDQGSPLKKATGSERDIINPLENLMNMVNKTVRTARYNEVGKSLLDSVRKAPDKMAQFAEVLPGTEGMFSNLDNVVTVMENGKPVYLKLNDASLLESMKGLYTANPSDIEKAAKKATGMFKSLITQKNPVFAVRNIARDIPTAYIYGSEKNPLKFGKDLVSASKDLITNSDTVKQYRAMGGGGSNFFKADKVTESAKELIKGKNIGGKIIDGIEYFNNLTESAPRLAEFKRIFEKTGDAQKALFAANDVTTNFSRGGDITKKLDSFVPYMNAGFQGLDKLARSLDPRDPKKALGTLIKGGIAITLPTAFFQWINMDNPNYKELDNRTKDTYYLIPTGDTFIKIPKSRELGVMFGSLFERLHRASQGEENAFKGFGNTVATNFSPANPIEDNIAMPIYNLYANKDFAGRTIVPQSLQKLSPKLQYDEKTSEVAKAIGSVANLSPKQIDYIIKSYTGVIGQTGIPATTKGGNPLKSITTQFTADPAYSSQAVTDFYDNYDEWQKKAADKNFTEKIPSKVQTAEEKITSRFRKAAEEITEINKKIRQINASDSSNKETEARILRKQIVDIAKKANESVK